MRNKVRRGIFLLYNTGMAAFFAIAVIVAIILINAGLMIAENQKQVVEEVVVEVENHLAVAGKISGPVDLSSSTIIATATPIRTATDVSVGIKPQLIDVSYKLMKWNNLVISYDDIYVGTLHNDVYNTIEDAVADAKKQGMLSVNPFIDEQKLDNTSAFVYWVINQNFDQNIDYGEYAILAIVYAEKDRPSTGEHILVQIDVSDGYILKLEREIPNISGPIISFAGKVKDP